MIVLSWDVGIVNLSFCVLEYNSDDDFKIIDWQKINLLETEEDNYKCCATVGKTNDKCDNKAVLYYETDEGRKSYCNVHKAKSNLLSKSENDITDKDYVDVSHMNVSCDKCETCAKMYNHCENSFHCKQHFKTDLKNMVKKNGPVQITKKNSKKLTGFSAELLLFKKLDELLPHFLEYGVKKVVIENQPNRFNQSMKSFSVAIYSYFIIRCVVDNKCFDDVKFMNAKFKTSLFKKVTDDKKKYKMTKNFAIEYATVLLKDKHPDKLEFMNSHSKKDDLADSFLQGYYYLSKVN